MNIAVCIKIMRPHQWLKNLILFFPPFLSGTLFSFTHNYLFLLPFISFCMASSSTYILNDLFDKENDRLHPEKLSRAIVSGQISTTTALILAAVLLVGSVVLAWGISLHFVILLSSYFVISTAYSAKLKNIALVDIFCISTGFLLRLLAGGAAFDVLISEWLFLSVFLLSVFLSTGKRLAEKQRLGFEAHLHRRALKAYPDGFLEGIMYMTGASVLVTYAMYVLSRQSSMLLYSVPLCCFGLLRYILRVQSGNGGDPTESLIRDVPLLLVGMVWVVMVGWGIYG